MDTPHITACIVTYQSNVEDVFRAVKSVKAATLPIELIIVDNLSGTKYRNALAEALSPFSDVRIINSGANNGFGAGHNFGFGTIGKTSEFHIVCNPDIIVHAGAIEAMVEYLQANPKTGLIAPKVVDPQGKIQHLCRRYPTVLALFARRCMPKYLLNDPMMIRYMDAYHMRDHDYEDIMEPECISGCFMIFRSDIYRALGGFDESFFLYFEDNDITLRLRKIRKAIYFPKAVVTHAWKGGGRQSLKLTKLQIQSARIFFRKWGWKLF